MANKPEISFYGDQAILLQWDFDINPENLKVLRAAKAKIEEVLSASTITVINTYQELLVIYQERGATLMTDIKKLQDIDFTNLKIDAYSTRRRLEVPVCYEEHFGLDIKALAEAKDISVKTLINWHTEPVYTVYFIGFLPGFPYLGGLDKRLAHSRRANPRKQISKGSVGIAEGQTGIYPQESPAGWQIIGNCPIPLFNKEKEVPSLLQTGDEIIFNAISMDEYEDWQARIKEGSFKSENLIING